MLVLLQGLATCTAWAPRAGATRNLAHTLLKGTVLLFLLLLKGTFLLLRKKEEEEEEKFCRAAVNAIPMTICVLPFFSRAAWFRLP